MYTLGIETSCDETSCAVLKKHRVLSNVTASSLKEHKKYGGVVPEIATRAHLANIDSVADMSLKQASISIKDIGLIAVTHKPGLTGALVVGLNFAKALSLALEKPFLGINHLHAHLFAPFLNNPGKLRFPFLGVVVSGGHTDFYLVKDFTQIKTIGATLDDAAGEVFDKVAVNCGLGYPGGPVIDRMFEENLKESFCFKCGRKNFNLSFSGIKTAVINKRKQLISMGRFNRKALVELVSSFQSAVVDSIVDTALSASKAYSLPMIVCGGGVAANSYFRKRLFNGQTGKSRVLISPIEFSGDNAAMVAGLGFYLYNKTSRRSRRSRYSLEASSG